MNKFLTVICGMAVSAFLASGATFSQCPAVGNDTSGCELLVSVSAVNGAGLATTFTVATSSPDLGPYDGVEDTLVGIVNNAATALKSINFSAVVAGDGIFDFDGDGACATITCTNGAGDTTGYAGPHVNFSNISGSVAQNGTVNLNCTAIGTCAGIATGASEWFSLEEAISASALTGTPEPATFALLGLALIGLGAAKLRKR